jgi:hypothetical protein
MKIENVVDAWGGPGDKDSVITPIKPEENALYAPKSRFYGEWWYFDARLDDGHVVVGFLQASELMSRKPGIELHIYRPSGEKLSVVRKFSLTSLRASKEKCDVWVGKNHCQGDFPDGSDLPVHHMYINEGGMEADLKFESVLPGWKPGQGRTDYGDRGYFFWVVPVPRARVTGTVRIGDEVIEAKGTGYHDHNVITADARRIISHWYWGRLYTDDFTLLYAYVKTNKHFGGVASKPLMLAYKDKVILSSGEMVVTDSDFAYNDVAHREYPRALEIVVPGSLSLGFDVKDIIDAHDLLDDMPKALMNPVTRALVHRFVGRPGWFRFSSDFKLTVLHEGKTFKDEGTTLHEMVALE